MLQRFIGGLVASGTRIGQKKRENEAHKYESSIDFAQVRGILSYSMVSGVIILPL